MATTLGKLNPKTVSGAMPPGYHSDGGNLYLVVKKGGAKSWAFIYRWKGRELEKGAWKRPRRFFGACARTSGRR